LRESLPLRVFYDFAVAWPVGQKREDRRGEFFGFSISIYRPALFCISGGASMTRDPVEVHKTLNERDQTRKRVFCYRPSGSQWGNAPNENGRCRGEIDIINTCTWAWDLFCLLI